MRCFVIKCVCILTLLAIPVLGNVFLLKSMNDGDAFILANIDKNRKLKSISKPKLVLIGGSNLAFGLNCQILADSLPYLPLNMGLHGGIGLHYMMREVEPYMRDGDILMIISEYELFRSTSFYGEASLNELLAYKGQYDILLKSPSRYSSIVLDCMKATRDLLVTELMNSIKLAPNPHVLAYLRSSFNSFGDNMGHWDLPSLPITNVAIKGKIDREVLIQISEYIRRLGKRGVKCVIFPPVYKRGSALLSAEFINQAEKLLEDSNIAFQVPPQKYVFADSLFYDTSYHLNKRGVDKRTLLLLNDIKGILLK